MSLTPDPDPDPEAQARQRFFLLAALRFGGVIMVMVGIAMMVGKIGPGGAVGRYAGFAVSLFGTFDVTVLPVLLARRWKRGEGQ
jgi:hypothetical protein